MAQKGSLKGNEKKKTPNQTKTSKYREQSNSYQREGDRSAQEEEKWVKNEYKMSTKCQLYSDGWGFFSGSVVEKEKNHLLTTFQYPPKICKLILTRVFELHFPPLEKKFLVVK